jgi:hypothetical protein
MRDPPSPCLPSLSVPTKLTHNSSTLLVLGIQLVPTLSARHSKHIHLQNAFDGWEVSDAMHRGSVGE